MTKALILTVMFALKVTLIVTRAVQDNRTSLALKLLPPHWFVGETPRL